MSTEQATIAYTPPDGAGDIPDRDGRHAASATVLHTPDRAARFHGCEQCAALARWQRADAG